MRKAAAVRIEPAFAGGAVADEESVQAGAQRKDRIAAALALIAAATIVVNALYLQNGPHPAPILSSKPATPVAVKVTKPAVETRPVAVSPVAAPQQQPQIVPVMLPRPRPADLGTGSVPVTTAKPEVTAVRRPPQDVPVARPAPKPSDPIAIMIDPPATRVMAVQRTLTEFGYGQLRPTGTVDPATQEAIGAFERARKLSVTQKITPALVRELSAMAGRPIE